MKRSGLFTVILIVMITISGYSQNGFNYKALISDNGNALANQNVTLRFTILENGTSSVYEETHAAVTDAHGIVSVQVGEGSVVSGDFNAIDWSQTQFLKVEIDTGNGFEDFGTSALQYVPYAKYADEAGNVFSGNYGDLAGTPDFTGWDTLAADDFSGDYNDLANRPDFSQWDTVAADDFSGDYNDLVNTPAVFTLEGDTIPAMHSADNIQHRGSMLIGDSLSSAGAGTSTLRINRRSDDNHYSYGVVSYVDGSGSGRHYGSYNVLSGSGTGWQVGTKNLLTNIGNAPHIAAYNVISNDGSGYHNGSYNLLDGAGAGTQYGTRNWIKNTGNGIHYGTYNNLSGSGKGEHYGIYNILSGTGTSYQYAVYNIISNNGDANHFGIYNELMGSGSGIQYGIYNNLTNSGNKTHYGIFNSLGPEGSGIQYGVFNQINNTGNNRHYATYNFLNGSGAGDHYGVFTSLSGTGSGNQYGSYTYISNSGVATHYGSYIRLTGSGEGSKYGSYIYISPSAGGNHYALFADARKPGAFAGYFLGDVRISQKLKGEASGDADMKAYIYGMVDKNGNVVTNASSSGFTASRTAQGNYKIVFNNSITSSDSYIVLATVCEGGVNAIGFVFVTTQTASYFNVAVMDHHSDIVDRKFSFVVYKK